MRCAWMPRMTKASSCMPPVLRRPRCLAAHRFGSAGAAEWFAQLQLRQLPTIAWCPGVGIARRPRAKAQARIWADVVDWPMGGCQHRHGLASGRVQWRDPARPALALADVQGRVSAQWQTQAARASWAIQAQRWALPGSRPGPRPSAGRPAIGRCRTRPPGPSSICACTLPRPMWAWPGSWWPSFPCPLPSKRRWPAWPRPGSSNELHVRWSHGGKAPPLPSQWPDRAAAPAKPARAQRGGHAGGVGAEPAV